jgi:hypothetical protein
MPVRKGGLGMDPRIGKLTESLTLIRNPGASESMIRAFLRSLNAELPDDYLDFLRMANGAEGPIGQQHYLALYSIDAAIECNKTYGEWVPWLVFFGTSGSISGFGFDTRSATMPVLEVDWIGLDRNPMYLWGTSFVEFLENLAKDAEPARIQRGGPPAAHRL